MENKKIFTQSDKFKSEYSCAVVKVGELTPIEGSDFLAKTLVTGTQIVVRKDQVKEGDIMFYAANETQLNEKFLSVNNLFDIGERDKNANFKEVEAILQPYLVRKPEIDKVRQSANSIKKSIDGLTKKSNKFNKEIKKLTDKLEGMDAKSEECISIKAQISDKTKIADECYKKALEMTTVYTNLKNQVSEMVKTGESYVTEAKKYVGFFNKYGRVRCLTLKGTPSFGFLFSIKEMQKYNSSITEEDIMGYLDQEFDTVDGELFVKAYVPPVKPENVRKSRGEKRQKKLKQFDRLVEGEFAFHYDTTQLQKNMRLINPDDTVVCTAKLHGTSLIVGKLKVKEPKKLPIHKWLFNKFVDITGLFKSKRCIDYTLEYGPVYSSRTVIKNRYINKNGNEGGFYKVDVWSEWGEIIYPYLTEGMTIYGEILGYETGAERPIQKFYDYGCEKGENKLMIYRITTTTLNGTKYEWEVDAIRQWTEHIIDLMKKGRKEDIANRIHPIDILYYGTLNNLYPEISTEEHWHENVLEAMKNDKEHFGMEEDEPLCTYNKVPREGIVLRKVGDPIKEAFKLKTQSFLMKEALQYDSGNYVDIEVAEGNY